MSEPMTWAALASIVLLWWGFRAVQSVRRANDEIERLRDEYRDH